VNFRISVGGINVSGNISGLVQPRALSYCYWDTRYNTYLYWNSTASGYYYWCAPRSCFYPITHRPFRTYSWAEPVGGVLPTPAASVLTVAASAIRSVNVRAGVAPPPVAD